MRGRYVGIDNETDFYGNIQLGIPEAFILCEKEKKRIVCEEVIENKRNWGENFQYYFSIVSVELDTAPGAKKCGGAENDTIRSVLELHRICKAQNSGWYSGNALPRTPDSTYMEYCRLAAGNVVRRVSLSGGWLAAYCIVAS